LFVVEGKQGAVSNTMYHKKKSLFGKMEVHPTISKGAIFLCIQYFIPREYDYTAEGGGSNDKEEKGEMV
jgi:hypothetical protein